MMGPFPDRTWADSARELEDLGYSTLFVPDHFDEGYGPLTALATAAAATTTLHVASEVLAVDFRHPAVLARELASIDLLSNGRLEVGLGTGYQVRDYRSSGIPMDPPGIRVERLMEYLQVLKGLFAPDPFSFDGRHYRIDELDGSPSPHRPGGPPILLAGGSKRMLSFAGAHADIVGINRSLPTSERAGRPIDLLPEGVDEKVAWVREAAGARLQGLEIHAYVSTAAVTERAADTVAELATRIGLGVEQVLSLPVVLVGTEDEIVARIHERRERWGFSYFTVPQPVARSFAPVVARFA
jgi:probable F420-dependent oxidoreductase